MPEGPLLLPAVGHVPNRAHEPALAHDRQGQGRGEGRPVGTAAGDLPLPVALLLKGGEDLFFEAGHLIVGVEPSPGRPEQHLRAFEPVHVRVGLVDVDVPAVLQNRNAVGGFLDRSQRRLDCASAFLLLGDVPEDAHCDLPPPDLHGCRADLDRHAFTIVGLDVDGRAVLEMPDGLLCARPAARLKQTPVPTGLSVRMQVRLVPSGDLLLAGPDELGGLLVDFDETARVDVGQNYRIGRRLQEQLVFVPDRVGLLLPAVLLQNAPDRLGKQLQGRLLAWA